MEVRMSKEKNKIQCTICKKDTSYNYSLLITNYGQHCKNRHTGYKIYLCPSCLFNTISHLKSQKRMMLLFEEDIDTRDEKNFDVN
ncbi:hypothetical protein CAT62_08115 [Acinetobacter pittii]|nr:hypothetical protein CAT62_08115 [Acinetobacter pittii]